MSKLQQRPTDRQLTDYEKAYGCFLFTPCDAPGCDQHADAVGGKLPNYCYDHSAWASAPFGAKRER